MGRVRSPKAHQNLFPKTQSGKATSRNPSPTANPAEIRRLSFARATAGQK